MGEIIFRVFQGFSFTWFDLEMVERFVWIISSFKDRREEYLETKMGLTNFFLKYSWIK